MKEQQSFPLGTETEKSPCDQFNICYFSQKATEDSKWTHFTYILLDISDVKRQKRSVIRFVKGYQSQSSVIDFNIYSFLIKFLDQII